MQPPSKQTHPHLTILIGIFLLIVGVRLHLVDLLAYITPYFDDWRAGAYMRLYKLGELTLENLVLPFNGHIALWANLSNFLFFDLNQEQWDPRFHMLINAIIWASSGTLLAKIALSQYRQLNVPFILFLVLVLWLFPFSLMNALWGVQTHNYLMILLSLAAIWLTTTKLWSKTWCVGAVLAIAAPFTMGGGAFASISIFAYGLLKFIFDPAKRKETIPALKITFVMALFSLVILSFLSGGHDFYYAKSISDFFTTLAKTLSFPLSRDIFPSIILLAPLLILTIKAIQNTDLNDRMVSFTLTLFIFVFAIAVAIGYARGAGGAYPSVRYFEFLELYIIASVLALTLIQKSSYAIKPALNIALTFLWLAVMIVSGQTHIVRLSHTIEQRSEHKSTEESVVREYIVNRNVAVFTKTPIKKLPFAGPYGLQHFIENIEPLDMLPFELQVQPELINTDNSDGFAKNATIRATKKEFQVKYKHESVIGSYVPKNGGVKSTGTFVSQVIKKTERPYLMIPVMGYIGYKGLTLKVVDEVHGKEWVVKPVEINSSRAEDWREVFIKAPRDSFRLVASDTREDLWFGFAAPRTVGRLTMMTLIVVENAKYIWQFGLFLILFSLRKSLFKLFRPSVN